MGVILPLGDHCASPPLHSLHFPPPNFGGFKLRSETDISLLSLKIPIFTARRSKLQRGGLAQWSPYRPVIRTYIGRCSDLYWSTLRAILVCARTNIGSLADQYRFISFTTIAWEDSLQESVIHLPHASRLKEGELHLSHTKAPA